MAFVKMTQSIMGCEQGKVYDLDDDIARSLMTSKKAEPISASEFLQASRKADDEALKASILAAIGPEVMRVVETLGRAGNDGGKVPAPPGSGGGINFNTVTGGSDPAIEENEALKNHIAKENAAGRPAGMGRAMQLVGIVGHPSHFHPATVMNAQRRLQGMCGYASEQHWDENKKAWVYHQERDLAGGGVEVITRTGGDSLNGGVTYGFALKPEFLGNIFEISMEQSVFVDATTPIPVNSGIEVKWPAWDQYQAPQIVNGIMQPAIFSGISLSYEGEASPRVLTDGRLNMINFKISDLTAATALTRDFVVDNYLAFDSALTRMIGRAFGWMEDFMSIQGPGLGRPQGYFNSGATIAVARSSSTYKINSTDLTAMMAATSPMVWNELRWITNITSIPYLAILTNSSGTAIFQPNALVSQAMAFSLMDKSIGGRGAELMHRPMGSLLGIPVYFSEKVPTAGNHGDLSLVAPSQFGVARRVRRRDRHVRALLLPQRPDRLPVQTAP